MACPAPEVLLEFIDGRLAGPAGALFEEHLDACDGCRELVACAARQEGQRSPGSTNPLDDAPAPPIGELVHYRLEGVLSRGGHGVVWRARDLRLDRLVALKQARLGEPRAAARFAREMRITARLQHPSIVTLHEAGTSRAGEQFYTMELVDGPTLLERIEQAGDFAGRLALLPHAIAIAEALAYAHDRRIIHRDLKPANVVVGSFGETIILDWGLAKDLSANEPDEDSSGEAPSPGTTRAGAILGTPSYMPPEQAAGRPADERSDVYAIGAILYQVLTGSPPYGGASSGEVLRRIASEEAVPVEKLQPRVPPDLAAIVRRAMARAPEARYPTAKELAADLRKFTTGELVGAHRYRFWELAGHWVRRHRAIAASALAIGIIFSLWLRSALGAREEARLVQQFAQEAEAIESTLRIAELMPPHDIRGERKKVRDRMKSVEASLPRLGAFAEGPGRYALGRGALALHDLGAARAHLEKAWATGYRAPEVAHALGQTLGEQYRAALDEAAATESESARRDRRTAAERELREPALGYLRAGSGASNGTPLLVEALIALYEGRSEDALAKAQAAQRDTPSLYEAARLEGDAWTRMAADGRERGEIDAALGFGARAAGPYQRALEIGRSDEVTWLAECGRWYLIMTLHAERGKPVEEDAAAAVTACDRALAINPDSVRAFTQKSEVYWRLGIQQVIAATDPSPTFARSIEMAREAIGRDPGSQLAHVNLGAAWFLLGDKWERRHGIDPRPSLARAIESYQRAIAIRPTSKALTNLCNAHTIIGDYEKAHGGDPKPHWARAVESCRRASGLDPRFAHPYNTLGVLFAGRAEWELGQGLDPRSSVKSGAEALRAALEIQPSYAFAHVNLGALLAAQATWERAEGLDCSASVDESVRSSRRALALMPAYFGSYDNLADTFRTLALSKIDRRLDPTAALAEAGAALDAGFKVNARDHFNYLQRARVELLAARLARGGPGAPALFDAALAALARSAEIDSRDPDVPETEAEIRRWQAEWRLGQGKPAGDQIKQGLAAVARALDLNPLLAEAVAVRGALLELQSRGESSAERRAAVAAESQAALQRAREMNPLLARDYPR